MASRTGCAGGTARVSQQERNQYAVYKNRRGSSPQQARQPHTARGGIPTCAISGRAAEDAPGGTASGTGPADDDLAFSDESDEDEEDDDAGELVDLPPKPMPVARSRRVSVSAASTSRDKLRLQWQAKQQEIAKQKAKSDDEIVRIRGVLQKNVITAFLDEAQQDKIIEAMVQKDFKKDDVLIQQGDMGDFFYLLEEGTCEVYIKKPGEEEVLVKTCTPDTHNAFGELALMYNAPRAATVRAATATKAWCLDRLSFKVILMETSSDKRTTYSGFLSKVSILDQLSEMERMSLADSLEAQNFQAGDMIIKQGDKGDTFYIVNSGKVKCTKNNNPSSSPVELCTWGLGNTLAIALLQNVPRQATVEAVEPSQILCLHRRPMRSWAR